MVDDLNTQQPAGTPAATPDGAQNTENKLPDSVPYDRFKQINDEKKTLAERLAKLEAAEKERLDAEAIKKGNFQQIIDDLKPKAERTEALENTLKKYLAAEIETIPAHLRGLIPGGDVTMQLEWIKQAKEAGMFGRPTPPPTDAGAQGDPKTPSVKLTEDQRAYAKKFGWTDDQYIKYMNK